MSVSENIALVREKIAAAAIGCGRDPSEVTLLAAAKQQPVDRIMEAIDCGIDAVGENRVQEMLAKKYDLKAAKLHFIGHLQRNKVKDVVGNVSLIHSIDSIRLAGDVSDCALKKGIIQDVLLEMNVAREESKSGFFPEDITAAAEKIRKFNGLRVTGLMCVPPKSDNQDVILENFLKMRKIFVDISKKIMDNNCMMCSAEESFRVLSMGMSEDFEEAVRQGSTLVRLGRVIFGERTQGF